MADVKATAKAVEKKAEAAVKAVEKKVEAVEKKVEAAVKEAAPKKAAAPKKEAPAKTATPANAAPKKEAAPKAPAAKKVPAKKADPKASVIVEYMGKAIVAKDILARAEKAFAKANKDVAIKTIDIYVKPEEGVAYYVVNGVGSDDYKVVL